MGTDAVELLTRAVRIPSPSGKEGRLAAFLRAEMAQLGYRNIRYDSAGNVLGEFGRGAVRLLLCGHMDTVPGSLRVRKSGGRLYGRGSSDAKSPLCALLLAGASASTAGVKVTFAGATREESDGLGVKALIRSVDCDFAVFGEPSGATRITVGYRGRMAARVSIKTKGGHASSPWAHTSALELFNKLSRGFQRFAHERSVKGDRFRSVSIATTLLRAGSYQNVIPGQCEATLDVRVPPGTSCLDVQKALSAIAAEQVKGGWVRLDFDEVTEAYEADPGSVLVRAFQRGIIIGAGSRPMMVRKTGTGDMNTLASATGVPCVTYGPGDAGVAHGDEENVSLDDYVQSIEVLKAAIAQLAVLTSHR